MATRILQSEANIDPKYLFRYSNTAKPLRKDGPCEGCGKRPPQGSSFRACAGCKAVLYCSKSCQKTNWAGHRANCLAIQKLARDDKENVAPNDGPGSSWPRSMPMKERLVVLNRFLALHMETLLLAVYYFKTSRPSETLNPNSEAVVFELKYRPDNDGNPAKMLLLEAMNIVPLEEVLRSADEHKLALREKSTEEVKMAGCTGLLHLSFIADNIGHELQIGCREHVKIELPPVAIDLRKHWQLAINLMIEGGYVCTLGSGWGTMVKKGGSWKWTRARD